MDDDFLPKKLRPGKSSKPPRSSQSFSTTSTAKVKGETSKEVTSCAPAGETKVKFAIESSVESQAPSSSRKKPTKASNMDLASKHLEEVVLIALRRTDVCSEGKESAVKDSSKERRVMWKEAAIGRFLAGIRYRSCSDEGPAEWDKVPDKDHRNKCFRMIEMNEKAITWCSSRGPPILILNCNDSTDDECMSPMSEFAGSKIKHTEAVGGVCINFRGCSYSDYAAHDIVIWFIGQFIEKELGSSVELPPENTGVQLLEFLEKLILEQLKKTRMLIVLDGLVKFESSLPHSWRMTAEDLKETENAQSRASGKTEEGKKSTKSQKAESSKQESASKTGEEKMSTKAARAAALRYDHKTATDVLAGLVNTLVSIAEWTGDSSCEPLKLLFINQSKSRVLRAIEVSREQAWAVAEAQDKRSSKPKIPVINVRTERSINICMREDENFPVLEGLEHFDVGKSLVVGHRTGSPVWIETLVVMLYCC